MVSILELGDTEWDCWEYKDLRDIPTLLSVISQVEETHMGLGLRIAFSFIVNKANGGEFVIGEVGIGKTTQLNALKYLTHQQFWEPDYETLAGIKKHGQSYLSNKSTTWIVKDFSRQSPMVMEGCLKLACALLTEYGIGGETASYSTNIENARLSFFAAMHPETFSVFCNNPSYRGNYGDRILRSYVFRYNRRGLNEDTPHPNVTLNSPELKDVKLDDNSDEMKAVKDMLEYQFEDERAELWSRRLLRATASHCHRNEVLPCDAKFLRLFAPTLSVEPTFGTRDSFGSALVVDCDALALFGQVMKKYFTGGLSVKYLFEKKGQSILTINDAISRCKGMIDVDLFNAGSNGVILPSEMALKKFNPQLVFLDFCRKHARDFYAYG